jgi:hypothetical protein
MVSARRLLVLCALAVPVLAEAAPARGQAAVERITIAQGTARSEDPAVDCGALRIDERRVRYFLRHAQPSTRHNYAQAYESGSCGASATVHYRDGRQVRLAIDDGTGWGTTSDRRSTTYLYCEQCTDLLEPDFGFKEAPAP